MKSLFMKFLGICAVLLSLAVNGGESWQRWSRNPLTIPVTVTATNLYAGTNFVLITLADMKLQQQGIDCSTPTNFPVASANLQVRREFQLTVVATNFTGVAMQLTYQPNWSPLDRRGKAAKPKNYQLLVDRVISGGQIQADYGTNGPCGLYSNTWTIELTERLPSNWRLEDGSDDPNPAPGDGKLVELGPGKSADKFVTSFDWSVSIGRLFDGRAAGRIGLRDSMLKTNSYAAANLFYTCGNELARDEVELVTVDPYTPTLRQIKATQTFVDIVESTNNTEMRFYLTNQVGSATNSYGHYTNITGAPLATWIVMNPNSSTNRLQIIEKRDATLRTNELAYDGVGTNTWTLTYGTGAVQHVETRRIVLSGSPATQSRGNSRYPIRRGFDSGLPYKRNV